MSGVEGEGEIKVEHSGLYRAVKLNASRYTFVKSHGKYKTESEPQCKLWSLDNNDVLM